jgi:hypothetical protein
MTGVRISWRLCARAMPARQPRAGGGPTTAGRPPTPRVGFVQIDQRGDCRGVRSAPKQRTPARRTSHVAANHVQYERQQVLLLAVGQHLHHHDTRLPAAPLLLPGSLTMSPAVHADAVRPPVVVCIAA